MTQTTIPDSVFVQTREIRRVRARLAGYVLSFLHAVGVGNEFTVRALHRFVEDKTKGAVAPASADRVMRLLQSEGWIKYSVVSRCQSLYRVEEIR